MSNHIERAYISQWYGANGLIPTAALTFIATSAGRTGNRRTWAPVPAWVHRLDRASAIVPNRSVPTLKTAGPGRAAASRHADDEVVGVDELVPVGAVAEHDRVLAVGDPVEQDREDPEASVAEDGPRADDRHVEPAVRSARQAGPLGGELGVPVGLVGLRDRRRAAPGWPPGTPNTALDEVWTTLLTPAAAQASSRTWVPSTLTERSSRRSRTSGTWATLWYTTSTPSTARRTASGVADVGGDDLDAELVGAGDVDVEQAHRVAARGEPVHEDPPEVAVASGDEADRHSSSPCSTHQRMLRRIPSSSSICGSYPSSSVGRPRCRTRSSCPSRRGRGPPGRSARCAGSPHRPARRAGPPAAGRRTPVGSDRRSPRRRGPGRLSRRSRPPRTDGRRRSTRPGPAVSW